MSARLALIEVLDGEHVRHSLAVPADAEGRAELRIGRALDCELVLDDPHLAAHHALLRVEADPAASRLTLLPSLNGAWQGRRHHGAGAELVWPADGVIQLGHSRLRLRHAAAALAPEQPPLHGPSPRWLGPSLLAGLGAAGLLGEQWVSLEPEARWSAYLMPLLGVAAALVIWSAFWALLQQLFQRRFPFLLHLRRALLVLLGVMLAGWALPALAFIASAPALLLPLGLLPPLAFGGLVVWHAQAIWPRLRRVVLALVLGALALWLALDWARQEPLQHRWRPPYLATVLPPAWRAAPLQPVDSLLEQAAALKSELAAKARQDAEGGESEEE